MDSSQVSSSLDALSSPTPSDHLSLDAMSPCMDSLDSQIMSPLMGDSAGAVSSAASQHYHIALKTSNSGNSRQQQQQQQTAATASGSSSSHLNSQPPTPTQQMRSDSPQTNMNVVDAGERASDTAAAVTAAYIDAYRATAHLPSNLHHSQHSVHVSSANSIASNSVHSTAGLQHSPPLHRSHPYHRPGSVNDHSNSTGVSHTLLRSSNEMTLNEYNRSNESGMDDILRHCPLKIRTTESLSSGVGIGNYMIGGGSGLVSGIHDADGYNRMTLKQEPETGY